MHVMLRSWTFWKVRSWSRMLYFRLRNPGSRSLPIIYKSHCLQKQYSVKFAEFIKLLNSGRIDGSRSLNRSRFSNLKKFRVRIQKFRSGVGVWKCGCGHLCRAVNGEQRAAHTWTPTLSHTHAHVRSNESQVCLTSLNHIPLSVFSVRSITPSFALCFISAWEGPGLLLNARPETWPKTFSRLSARCR